MNFDIMQKIHSGQYQETKRLTKAFTHADELLALAFDTDSVAIYVYACFAILEKETPILHEKAARIMDVALIYYNGYNCGIMHERRMVHLEPGNLTYLSHLLYDNHIPDHLVRDDEAYQISLRILSNDPLHKFAREMKEQIENRRLHNVIESKTYIPGDEQYPEFVKLVHTGFYEEAKALVSHYSFNEFEEIVYMLMDRHQSVAFYTYAFFMLLDQETVQGHLLAGKLLLQLKNVFGSQSGALFHARRARELAPNSLAVLDFFLSFYSLANHLISDVEAIYCAREILTIDPEHACAKKIITKFQKI